MHGNLEFHLYILAFLVMKKEWKFLWSSCKISGLSQNFDLTLVQNRKKIVYRYLSLILNT
jgi:predicted small integral membrane protein